LISESFRVPLSTYLVINEEDCLDLIDQMRTAIPQEIKAGERIQQERERIIAQAQEEAERVVQLARDEASGLLEQHELIQAANQRVKTITERAQREADALRREADEYARQVLLDLRDQLGVLDGQIDSLLKTVHNGLDALSQAPAAEAAEGQ
jgi:cell division septum initiation protein DivIVA